MNPDAPPYESVTRVMRRATRRDPGSAIRAVLALRGAQYLRRKVEVLLHKAQLATTDLNGGCVECLLCPGALNDDGYQQVNILSASKATGAKQETAYLHHLVHWYTTGEILSSWAETISHLCHHPDCIQPAHLVKEENWRNIRRQSCGGPDVCACHDTAKCVLP